LNLPDKFSTAAEAAKKALFSAFGKVGIPMPGSKPTSQWVKGVKGSKDDPNLKIQQKLVGLMTKSRVETAAGANYESLLKFAVTRIMERQKIVDPEEGTLWVLALIRHLDVKVSLTINFSAKKYFGNGPCTWQNYKQAYEVFYDVDKEGRRLDKIPAGAGSVAGASADQRDKDELTKILKPSGPQPAERGLMTGEIVTRFADTGGFQAHPKDEKFLVAKNPHFVGMSRPRYAALNYRGCPNGACPSPLYGKSVFILKDYMKDTATFTHNDTQSSKVTSEKVCTRETLGALLAWMTDAQLDQLCDYFIGVEGYPYEISPMDILECQMFRDVEFDKDVQSMGLSISEAPHGLEAEKYAIEFCKRNNISGPYPVP
jgi:hypothetical protein